MNMLQTGLNWLAQKQKKHVSSRVLYCRGEKSWPVDATLGRTTYEVVDDYGFKIFAHATDFLIRAADLPLVPQLGDRILLNDTVHEVLELGADGCWRWSDPHGITRRIHTKQL